MATADSMERLARAKVSGKSQLALKKQFKQQKSAPTPRKPGREAAAQVGQFAKDYIFDPGNPADWALLALPAVGKGAQLGVKGAQAASRAAGPAAARALTYDALKRPQVAMQLGPESAEGVIRSGQFKNAFMLGDEAGQMPVTGTKRARSEVGLGVPLNAPASQRPNYGILTSRIPRVVTQDKSGSFGVGAFDQPFRQTNRILSPSNPNLVSYTQANRGLRQATDLDLDAKKSDGVMAIFKPNVNKRTTFTRGDSNPPDWGAGGTTPPINVNTASKADIKKFAKDILVPYKDTMTAPYYIEAQIFGKLGINDVKKFVAGNPELAKKLRTSLKEVGSKTKVTLSNEAKLAAIKSILQKLKPPKKQAPILDAEEFPMETL
jgi:hypothetical protein